MKWFITRSLILFAVLIPIQAAQADDPNLPTSALWPRPLANGKDPEGKPVTASHHWTGRGTSPVETMTMAQKPMMMTMYHTDKGGLMLTHYCKLGNQPRMRADMPDSTAKTLAFNFVDITNLAQPTDPHMHKVSFTFQDQDHFTQEWMLSKDGKEVPHRFEFARKK